MSHAIEARRLLRTCRSGALATVSSRLNGHPFVSAVPFMSDYDGSPILLISRLAEHTKNIEFDARVSLMVHEPHADIQAAARLTLAGTCHRLEATASLEERYLRLFPAAKDLLTLDFDFHRIVATAIRYIGGFGKIHWLSTETFSSAGGVDAAVEQTWLKQLAEDPTLAGTTHGKPAALDCDGIDVRDESGVRRIPFAASATTPQALHAAIYHLAQRCNG